MKPVLSLATRWTEAASGAPSAYELSLTNSGPAMTRDFTLCFSGPARIDPQARIEGGRLVARISNFSGIAPPTGFVLKANATWTMTVYDLAFPLRHWTDGPGSAYVVMADGSVVPALAAPTTRTDGDALLRSGAVRSGPPSAMPVQLSIIPWPNLVSVSGLRTPPTSLELLAKDDAPGNVARAFSRLVSDLFPLQRIVGTGEGALPVRMTVDPTLPPEAYGLSFSGAEALLSSSGYPGFLYGLVTLGQLLRGSMEWPEQLKFPERGHIADAPALKWRGTHLDVARRFYPVAEVKRLLDLLAWNKMNRFHWHLSDDEAWRVEIDAYPQLTAIGSLRGHGLALPPLLGSGPAPSGGYYTKAEIREVVAHAHTLGIEIVPEIDMPGHCYAVLQALPELRDPAEGGAYESVQGFANNCLNPARDTVYRFVEAVIDEMLELFPDRIFHIGADEVPLAAWSGSPEALALLERLAGPEVARRHAGLSGSTATHGTADAIEGAGTAILQAYFVERLQRYIAGRGAICGGWEEAAHGDAVDRTRSYLVGWRDIRNSAALAERGYDVVVSPGQRYYLDMANDPQWEEPGAGWAGSSSPEQTYRFEPRAGWSTAQLEHLLGVQTSIWSEPMNDPAIFDRLVFPRLSAVAETGWTMPEHKSWERFSALSGLMPIMYGHWEEAERS